LAAGAAVAASSVAVPSFVGAAVAVPFLSADDEVVSFDVLDVVLPEEGLVVEEFVVEELLVEELFVLELLVEELLVVLRFVEGLLVVELVVEEFVEGVVVDEFVVDGLVVALLVGAGVAVAELVGVGVGVAAFCCACQVSNELIRDHSVQLAVVIRSPSPP
jgi:hypothetical protein